MVDGKTAAEVCGLKMEMSNKWISIIEDSSSYINSIR